MNINHLIQNGEPWLVYAIKKNLLNEEITEDLTNEALACPYVKKLIQNALQYNSKPIKGHKDPELPIYSIEQLLEIGLLDKIDDLKQVIKQIMTEVDDNGIPCLKVNVPKHYGGSGEDTMGWMLCDAPMMIRQALIMNTESLESFQMAIDYLVNKQTKHFTCIVSSAFNGFRGPGRKGDMCPLGSLRMLNLYSVNQLHIPKENVNSLIGSFIELWQNSLTRHPYMFYMGTDFRKLKAPTIWYDLVSVLDVLSKFEYAIKKPEFNEMFQMMVTKMDENGLFTSESIYQKCKDTDYGQKKQPSLYLTYKCYQIMLRVNEIGY